MTEGLAVSEDFTIRVKIGIYVDGCDPWRPSNIPPGSYVVWARSGAYDVGLTADGVLIVQKDGAEIARDAVPDHGKRLAGAIVKDALDRLRVQ